MGFFAPDACYADESWGTGESSNDGQDPAPAGIEVILDVVYQSYGGEHLGHLCFGARTRILRLMPMIAFDYTGLAIP